MERNRRELGEMSDENLDALFSRISISSDTKSSTDPDHLSAICEAVNLLHTSDFADRLKGMKLLRAVTTQITPPLDAIIDSGITPVAIHFLSRACEANQTINDWSMVFEATWVILNLLSGNADQVNKLLRRDDAVDVPLIKLLLHHEAPLSVKDHACWGIGNIAATGREYRDKLLTQGAVHAVVTYWGQLVQVQLDGDVNHLARKFTPNVAWCLSNLSRSAFGAVDVSFFSPFAGVLVAHGVSYDVFEVAEEFCTVCQQLVDASDSRFAEVMATVQGAHYVEAQCGALLRNGLLACTGMTSLLSSLSTANDRVTEAFFQGNTVSLLFAIASSSSSSPQMRKLAFFTLSNVAATPMCFPELMRCSILDVCLATIRTFGSGPCDAAAFEAMVTVSNLLENVEDQELLLGILPPIALVVYGVCSSALAAGRDSFHDQGLLNRFFHACGDFLRQTAKFFREANRESRLTRDHVADAVLPFLYPECALEVSQEISEGDCGCEYELQMLWRELAESELV